MVGPSVDGRRVRPSGPTTTGHPTQRQKCHAARAESFDWSTMAEANKKQPAVISSNDAGGM